MKKISLAVSALLSLFAYTAVAAAIGDVAPELKVLKWVQGGPVELKAGQITVVEFWATWCPPCRATIPHLNEVYKKYSAKNVAIVGISNEKESTISKFIAKMGDKMTYPVAIGSQGLYEGYMTAFKVNGIPHAFIVDAQGKFAWHGHPMQGFEAAIDAAIAKRDAAVAEKPAETPAK